MFEVVNETTGAIMMNAGDTGAIKVHAERESGTAWTSADRMLFTVLNSAGTAVIQRYYRLDTTLGNGYALIQFHNDDTDELAPGQYRMERRYIVNPYWDGTAPTGDVTDALAEGVARIIEGDIVRIPANGQTTLTINSAYGEV